MDPANLASSLTALLAPLLAQAGAGLAEEAARRLPEVAGKLFNAIVSRFEGRPAAEAAVQDLLAQPEDPDNQEAFSLQLRKSFKEDPDFTAELAALLQVAQQSADISASGGSTLVTGSISSGSGGIAVGGNVGGNVVLGNRNVISSGGSGPGEE